MLCTDSYGIPLNWMFFKGEPGMRRSAWILAGALALGIALGSAPAAVAQVTGLFYREMEKDGRVYVFNTPEKYEQFQQTGDMGTAITLVGRGPNGETVVAENETAADLYFFKHNLEPYERPTPKPQPPAFTVGWKDGKTTITTKQAELVISNRLQVRATDENREVEPAGDPDRTSFTIRRMRTKFDGWVYTKDLTYELQFDTAQQSNLLQDANVNYDFTKGRKAFMLKAGQYKVPFGRQELTSSGNQQFVDRSVVSGTFARGRDIGVQLWGTPFNSRIDWRVGVFNGNGRTVSRNDNDDLQVNARLMWQPFGDVRYSESDFESTDRPLLALGVGYEGSSRPVAAAGTTAAHENDQTITAADVAFKFKGFSLFGELFQRENDRTLATLSDFDDSGFVLQAGYFVIPQKLEIALRFGELDPNDDVDDNEREERGLALGYFFNKHNHKLQADYRELEDIARRATDKEARLQYQIIF
jgi:phosphate-selective porin OprO and OprP